MSAESSSSQPNVVKVRVSLEGIEDGVPIRFSQTLEAAVQDGWQNYPMVLETVGWEPNRVKSLRTTIDLLSPGVIRIDDVRVHRQFATTQQQESLQKRAFLAVQGFKRGNLTQSSDLLSNVHVDELLFRPEYQTPSRPVANLTASRTKVDEPGAVGDRAEMTSDNLPSAKPGSAEATNGADDPPAISSRWRTWWPQSLRF